MLVTVRGSAVPTLIAVGGDADDFQALLDRIDLSIVNGQRGGKCEVEVRAVELNGWLTQGSIRHCQPQGGLQSPSYLIYARVER